MPHLKKKVLAVFGTRPEAIKMAPVIKALEKKNNHFDLITCVTAQHRQILDQMLNLFQIKPDIDLDIMEANQTLPSLTAKAVTRLSEVMDNVKPDVTLVQGDTTTAMVAGLASFYGQTPVGHVEAGLRTENRYNPFPEEINRRLLSTLSTFHFAPTQSAVNALLAEGYCQDDIFMTGNTVIDALLMIASREYKPRISLDLQESHYILVTAHRRENFGQPIKNICKAFKEIVQKNKGIEIVYPVHPNPNIAEPVRKILSDQEKIHLIPPLEYEDFVFMMKNAHLILSDSGGVQEEAPSLGKPVLVLRETTERPEAVEAGVAKLVGTEASVIVAEVENLLNNDAEYQKMSHSVNPFGDGQAADRIARILNDRILGKR
ncbi:UDP-N-acetylglucosamine 2-epimerase (non-hydrolyzing) [Desulfococcaceae bacterium HSG9]|nr:UDP-N-acetylglucosamine 2-epimerase (non-hydrolyzing) [Desulfococcaceae bacterium HSG9]